MFETLMRLYAAGKGPLRVTMLANAVIKGWITEEENKEILATKNKKNEENDNKRCIMYNRRSGGRLYSIIIRELGYGYSNISTLHVY